MQRFTRLTNGCSKKLENQGHAVALHFSHYNFCRIHKTLRVTHPRWKRVWPITFGDWRNCANLLPALSSPSQRMDKILLLKALGE